MTNDQNEVCMRLDFVGAHAALLAHELRADAKGCWQAQNMISLMRVELEKIEAHTKDYSKFVNGVK